jgi:hypothetical protein
VIRDEAEARPGARVIVVCSWSSLNGLRGVVEERAAPGRLWVRLDGEERPLVFGLAELALES